MGGDPGRLRQEMKEEIRQKLLSSGAAAVGFAAAGKVPDDLSESFEKWIKEGHHAGMDYLERHIPLRRNTDSVLPGAKTVISLAFSYVPGQLRDSSLPYIASYAYGMDYHKVIRRRLEPLIREIRGDRGGEWRICVDSAPVEERYWAVMAGIGMRGMNGSVIVDGCGSLCFLAEILTTHTIDPDSPALNQCDNCSLCVDRCPTRALRGDGTMDARRCLSYITIEKRGDFSEEEKRFIGNLAGRQEYLFGCDRCLTVCPHNKFNKPTEIAEFRARPEIMAITKADIMNQSENELLRLISGTPLVRCKPEGLRRNLGLGCGNNP